MSPTPSLPRPSKLDTGTPAELVRPLVVALLLSLALYPTLVHLIALQTLPEWVGRYWANGYCRFMLALFGWVLIYAALQWIGIDVERGALVQGAKGASRIDGWLAFLSGREGDQAEEAFLMSLPHQRLRYPNAESGTSLQEIEQLLGMLGQRQQQALAPLAFAIWVLPMLGFIGTVIGISQAIGGLSQGAEGMAAGGAGLKSVLGGLAFAFDTTLVGLVCVIPLALIQTVLRLRAETLGLLRYRWLLERLAQDDRHAHAEP
ncbi:MotA/TolQ/ExbB proton channel family protein [Caldichromatium japonicum]|uniref:MotA/TolQ/ExbB proton channel family protein n=1 Tax=Caldichromatium japonicum TaxID=2699430 RepID=A0A6G7VAU5_9GAMM|nr:MotA/TolQ/ExbB proton channel family protein [Caldichromatium japonicum]QIK37072.1 MotA/TolQ/ExbB proton channel family protein [Caldichromatium japonicum]